MKKTIFLSGILAVSLAHGALSDEEILGLFAVPGGVETSVESRAKIEGTNFEKIILLAKQGKEESRQIMFSDGKYLFPDVIDVKNKRSYASEFEAEQAQKAQKIGNEKLKAVLKTYPKDKIMELGDGSKEQMYLFTDPLCPYCMDALADIENTLKQFSLKVFFTPIRSHGKEAVALSLQIQKEMKELKTDADKIALMRKYYGKKDLAPKLNDDELKAEQKLINSVFATGAIKGVPAMIEASELK